MQNNIQNYKAINLPFYVNETNMDIEVIRTNITGVFNSFDDENFLDNKPGVYCFFDKVNLYIGESTNPFLRLKTHISKNKLKREFEILVFRSDKFNKSAIYDIETKLINYFASDNKYKLINEKTNQGNHNYFLKDQYEDAVDKIWSFLLEEGLAKYTIPEIEKMNIFKFSPYKNLNSDQSHAVESAEEIQSKLIMIKGYPGTGKSIVASTLYSKMSEARNVGLTAGTRAVTNAFKEVFKMHNKKIKTQSKVAPAKDIINSDFIYDVIIVDEAHRLLKKGGKGMGAKYMHLQKGQNELDELMKKCKKLIILYDANQKVHDGDFDLHFDKYRDSKTLLLREQMRAAKGYEFIDYMVKTFNGISTKYKQSSAYDVKVFENFKDMYLELRNKAQVEDLVRLLSGYSRKWKSKPQRGQKGLDNDRPYDFDIDGFKLRWNSKSEGWVNTEPAKNLEEIAYYTTIQGFDLNYAGVIIGKDVYLDDDGNIQINEDYIPAVNEKPKKADPYYNEKLKSWTLNRYKILLSRGVKGTYIYCEDEKLAKRLINEINKK